MESGRGGMGSHKHGTSGTVHTQQHFTGKQGSGAKRKRKLTRKQRRHNRGTHVNKYASDG
jgi:hypothetical protein